jgi:urea transport system permease protein
LSRRAEGRDSFFAFGLLIGFVATMKTALRHILLAIGLCFIIFVSPRALAETTFETALQGFAEGSFNGNEKAIGDVAESGDPRAVVILQALQDGHLFYTSDPKAVFYRDANGALFDAATGKKAEAEPEGLRQVRLNNRVRGALAAGLGLLNVLSPDPERRLAAAQSVFKSREASALPALGKAIAAEKDAKIKNALVDAQAAVLLGKADAPLERRLDAVSTIRNRGDEESLALLTKVVDESKGALHDQAVAAVGAVKTRLWLWSQVQNIYYGISLGSVLLLAAIGLAITFGVMGVINMAHGEMVMLGAYTTFVVQEQIREHAPHLFEVSLLIAVPLAFLVTGAIGILIERTIIRFLYGRPLETLLATFGLSLILQQAVRSIFGANNREVAAPAFMSGTFEVGGLAITYGRMWIIVFALIVFVALQALLRFTSFGLRMRAVTQNRRMASSMGINTNRVDALAFGLGSGIAGIAGVALSQIDNVSPNLGQSYIIDSFMVVVFGGVGNLWGTLLGSGLLGIANKVLEPWAGAVLGKIVILVLIILFIQRRPRGLFALKGRAVEA